jgi:site-specific DNA-methyltransferase (cytosine-N4-specific)
MFQETVMVPMGDWSKSRLRNLSETDKRRDESAVQSGFGKNISNWLGRKAAYPTNVIYLATECSNKNHSATFPLALPQWFIRLFTQPDDLVLDPFAGSGTALLAAQELGRNFIGIDVLPEYCDMARKKLRVTNTQRSLL